MRRITIGLILTALFAAAPVARLPGATIAPREQIVSSNPNGFDGITINLFLGAGRFYDAGYVGTRAIVGVVDAGHIWNGHETLTHVNTYVHQIGSAAGPQTGEFDAHGTAVGFTIGGRLAFPSIGDYQVGMAFDAELWSGAVATTFESDGSFDMNSDTFLTPYKQMLVQGVGPLNRTADVINSSFGFGDTTGALFGEFSLGIDALVSASNKIVTLSAGNQGPNPNTVTAPASGYNAIRVAALGTDLTNPPYNTPSPFSSRGPNEIFIPFVPDGSSGMIGLVGRAVVDIAAPGEELTVAYYGGLTGGNTGGVETVGNNWYATHIAGTSFSAPIVAGGAALLVDAGRDRFGGGTSIDGRVVKAVLLNAADKTAGWDNGQTLLAGTVVTTQSLDYAVGAGRMNLDRAFDQFLSGTTDLAGLGGGSVQPLGWDFGEVAELAPSDYYLAGTHLAGEQFRATLAWFNDRGIDLNTNTTAEQSYDNLDLELWLLTAGLPTQLVGSSQSLYNNVEHLAFDLPTTGEYMVRVVWIGEHWDFVGDANAEQYGLAWSVAPVPEPSTVMLAIAAAIALLAKGLRRRYQAARLTASA